jgi:hypothetical protein
VINICFRAILGCWRTCACYDMLSSWALGRQTNQVPRPERVTQWSKYVLI